MSTDMFDGPSSATGIDLTALEGSLLLVKPLEFVESINTNYGETSAVRADVIVLDGAQKGETVNDTLIFPKVLQSQVKSNCGTGRYNLGRLGRGAAKPGQSAPWMLGDPTDQDKDAARAWLAANAGPGF